MPDETAGTDPVVTADVLVRPVTRADLPAVRELNADNVPAVGVLDDGRVDLFLASATWLVAEHAGVVVATFVGLREGVAYESPNYRWFAERHAAFAYVDRIALHRTVRGTGLADALYRRWFADAADAAVPIACAEVNVVPPNPRSMAFHRRHGFRTVTERSPYGPDERVAMLERPITPLDGSGLQSAR